MNPKKGIRRKLTKLILAICIVSLVVVALCSAFAMENMAKSARETALNDAMASLNELAQNRADIADSMLLLAQNHTLLVAEGAKDILENSDRYLLGYNEENLPNLTCTDGYELGKYSVHVRVPEEILTNIEKDSDGTVTKAEINRDAKLNGKYTVNEELYLGSLLSNEFAQIERFKNDEGDYKGFAASYFCFDDSGIDVLGDPLATAMIVYDGRTRSWYTGAVEAYKNNTLTKSGVYWTEPVQDGSGRGISMICSAPVAVDGKVVGVAGSGGLLVNFAELIESTAIGSTGYSFIVSRNNSKVIINPNTSEKTSKQSEVMIETVLSESENSELKKLAEKISTASDGTMENIKIDGTDFVLSFSSLDNNDWTLVTVIGANDDLIMKEYNELAKHAMLTFIVFGILLVITLVSVILIASRFSKTFTDPIVKLSEGVTKIGEGNLEYKIDIKTGDEIEILGNSFNAMAKNLDGYIKNLASVTAEKERIGTELNVATHIQSSMLPCIFPAFPDRDEFDIYATMTPAKEVGGDFYDFFMVDKTHLAIVMADVSGKGVPAALFMVIAKTLIKDHTIPGTDLGDVFTTVNSLLCESNSGELFVTAFEGVLDLVTGEFIFVNAGHEMPFICKKNENYVPHKIRPGFVLAGMEGMKYKAGSIVLEPGDKLFEYTDGITEATNKDNKLYGMERLGEVLSKNKDKSPAELLPAVKADIDKFVGDAPQFDDITMLGLEYKKKAEITEE